MLLNLFSETDNSVLGNNCDLFFEEVQKLVKRDRIDWLLITECLKATKKIFHIKKDISEKSIIEISKILLKNYGTSDGTWLQGMQELINTINDIISSPEDLFKHILQVLAKPIFNTKGESKINQNLISTFNKKMKIDDETQELNNSKKSVNGISDEEHSDIVYYEKISQFFFVFGHICINLTIFSEKLESELKKKNEENSKEKNEKKKKSLKNKEEDDSDDLDQIGGGKEAELDIDIDVLHNIIENDFLYNNIIGLFVPLIIQFSKNSLKVNSQDYKLNYNENESLFYNPLKNMYKSAILCLTKLMTISQRFCAENIPLLFSIVESETIPTDIRCNIIIAFGDLINRWPNILHLESPRVFRL